MAEPIGNVAIKIPLLLLLSILGGKTFVYNPRILKIEEVGVDNSCFLGLVSPVEDLKYVSADQLVVAINIEDDRILAAVVLRSKVEVGEWSSSIIVFDVGVTLLVDGEEAEVVSVYLSTAVVGAVVDDHQLIVGIILREDRVEVGLYPELGVIVVARYDETHMQFFLYF